MLVSLCAFHKASTQVFNIYRKLFQKSPQEPYIHILSFPSVIFVASYMEQDWTCMCWVQHSPYTLEALHVLYVYRAFSTAVNSNWILEANFFNDIWWRKDLEKKEENQFISRFHSYPATHYSGQIMQLIDKVFWAFVSWGFCLQSPLRSVTTACQQLSISGVQLSSWFRESNW